MSKGWHIRVKLCVWLGRGRGVRDGRRMRMVNVSQQQAMGTVLSGRLIRNISGESMYGSIGGRKAISLMLVQRTELEAFRR